MTKNFLVPILLPADPVVSMEAATKQYVDNNRTSAGRIFYLTNNPADVATYLIMMENPSTEAESTFTVACSGTSDVLLGAFITRPGVPGAVTYPPGTAYRRPFCSTSAGIARLHLQVYVRNEAGTETLVRDEFSPNFANTTAALNEYLATPSAGGQMATTDRIVAKIYAQRVSGPTSINVTLYAEGATNASQIQTTIVGGSSASGTALDDLRDVTIATPIDGQVLTYNSGTSQWNNEDPTGGGGGSVSGTKLSALASITGALLATLDLIEVVDVSDTTMAASGTNKKITLAELVTYLNDVVTISAASETVSGRVELATAAETLTGTANSLAVHPAGLAPLVSGGGPLFGFLFDTATTAASIVNTIRFNSATPASITAVYVSYTPREGVHLGIRVMAATAGDRLFVQERDGGTYQVLEVTGAPTDNGSWASVPVVRRSGSATVPPNNEPIVAGFLAPPITVGTSAPASPLTNDIWIDTT